MDGVPYTYSARYILNVGHRSAVSVYTASARGAYTSRFIACATASRMCSSPMRGSTWTGAGAAAALFAPGAAVRGTAGGGGACVVPSSASTSSRGFPVFAISA